MKRIFLAPLAAALLTLLPSCDDNKSYAELLTDESHAVNNFLLNHSVEETLPGIEGNVDADIWFVKDDNVLPNRSFAFDAAESELYEAGAYELS